MENKKNITIEQLKRLEPLCNLSNERLEELMTLSYIEQMPIGTTLFTEGEIDNQTVYLLEGDLQLISADGTIDKVLSGNKEESKYPVDDSQPRQVTARALGRIGVVRIDNSVLDYMMMWDQLAVSEHLEAESSMESPGEKSEGYSDSKTPSSDEHTSNTATTQSAADDDRSWVRKMRHIMAFKNMPPGNIKVLLEKMETLLVKENDVVVQQGEEGEYYYVLTEGEAQVTRTVELANLVAGSSFGEEALVSNAKRNATVTMKTDGMLMRLSKRDFNQLLKEPLLDQVTPEHARAMVNKGACWLDVRHAREYSHNRLAKAINIPLHEIRMRLGELEKERHYVCYCSSGKRSSAAAFLLAQHGYQVSVLKGGIHVMASELVR